MQSIKETMQAEAEAQLKTVCLSRLHRELTAVLISYPPKLISLIRLTFNHDQLHKMLKSLFVRLY